MGNVFIGCVMYADDLLLISASLYDLQRLFDLCAMEACRLDMKFNANKSQIIRIEQMRRTHTCYISVGGSSVQFVHELKYLGWYIVSATRFKISIHRMRVRFLQCFNSLYSNCHNFSKPVLRIYG